MPISQGDSDASWQVVCANTPVSSSGFGYRICSESMIRVLAMSRLWFWLPILATMLLLGACASSGNLSIANETASTVSQQVVKGKTRQADVRRMYGDPIKTSFTSNGKEAWEYEFSRLQSKPTNFIPYVNLVHSGAEGEKKTLVVFFDQNKVVQDYTMSTSKVDISRGLITQ